MAEKIAAEKAAELARKAGRLTGERLDILRLLFALNVVDSRVCC